MSTLFLNLNNKIKTYLIDVIIYKNLNYILNIMLILNIIIN